MKTKHTPTPWKTRISKNGAGMQMVSLQSDEKYPRYIGVLDSHMEADEIDAAFIVRAVNNHEALLELAKKAIGRCAYPGCPECFADEKIIAQAEGKS